jgi:LAO/AO transport system kinase
MLEPLFERFRQGDRLALSRLLSRAARGESLEEIRASLRPPPEPSRVVAITGSGGVGKSTLIGKLMEWLRCRDLTVAVLACDPQSGVTGGALLGDRFRMPIRADDEGVFIRSLAAVSGRGAVADHLRDLIRILESFGFDVILIETVGAGQGDTTVHDLVDVTVLLLQPETGDDLQWQKAGLLEVADVIAIHKADLPQAQQLEAQVQAALALSSGPPVPVIRVSAKSGEGVEALWTAIASNLPHRGKTASGSRELLRLAQDTLATWFHAAQAGQHPAVQQLITKWQQGVISDRQAAEALLELLQKERGFPHDREAPRGTRMNADSPDSR